jgi:2-polyprenyl-3-methyl-5-hydroxy-6-metoxy-1,4-benzoquinol methylase
MAFPDLSKRSNEQEMLDAPGIPAELLFRNLQELDTINSLLGGHRISLKGLKKLLKNRDRIYQVADIGCGGGDTLKAMAQWGKENGFSLHLTGVDMNADAISFARRTCRDFPGINFIHADYRSAEVSEKKFDIISCALFCHHLDDVQLKEFFEWSNRNSTLGFIVNDLQRHPFAYYSISLLTKLFSRSPLVKNDAPLSVNRGFHKTELEDILKTVHLAHAELSWEWAFRYLLVCRKRNLIA